MKTRRIVALSLVAVMLVTAVVLSGCGKPKVKLLPGQTAGYVHDWFTEDPGTFDFQEDTTLAVYNLARNLFSTLVRFKGNTLDLEPELCAEMPTADSTGTVYDFKLKPGIKFSNGDTLTAADVKYTIMRMLDPNGKGASPQWFEPIVGAKDVETGKATDLAGFKQISDTEFTLTITAPYAPFLQNLAVPSASILPEKACKAAGDTWGQNPVGTGPFVVEKYEPNTMIVLKKNPNYFEAGLPKVSGVDYVVLPDAATALMDFENGQLDVYSPSGTELTEIKGLKDSKGTEKFNTVSYTPLNTYYILFNMKEPAFKDVRVRKAIAMAIDKQALLASSVFNGEGTVAKAFTTPGIPGAYDAGTGPAYDYNPEQAKALLAEAGVKDLKITLWQRGGQTASAGNTAIQGFLAAVGITADIQIVDSAAFGQARSKGQVPISYGNWWADYPSPDNYLNTYFNPTNTMSSGYNNPTVTALLDKAMKSTDQAERTKDYQEAEKIIIQDDCAIVPLVHVDSYYSLAKSISNYPLSPTGVVGYLTIEKAADAQ